MPSDVALIIGASSAIARALVTQLLQGHVTRVIAVSRTPSTHAQQGVEYRICDYSGQAIKDVVDQLKPDAGCLRYVFICNGVLHDARHQPEKRLDDLEAEALMQFFELNAVIPALWLKALLPLLRGNPGCVLTVLSARVGSISDNHKGGWYSYRASKAALNMLVRTAAVEYARVAPSVKVLAYHPGTVDTELSRPFQKNVPQSQLMTATTAAQKLLNVAGSLSHDGEALFLDWAGKQVEW